MLIYWKVRSSAQLSDVDYIAPPGVAKAFYLLFPGVTVIEGKDEPECLLINTQL